MAGQVAFFSEARLTTTASNSPVRRKRTALETRFYAAISRLSERRGERVVIQSLCQKRFGWKCPANLYDVLKGDVRRGGSPSGKRRKMVEAFIKEVMEGA